MAPKDEPGVSRRDFLKTVGVGGLAAGVVATADGDLAAQQFRAVGPGPVPITLMLNGRAHRLEVEPRTTLLDAIRDRLQLTGTKRVCDRGSCGACTVIMDGRTIYACSTLAIEAQGRQLRTIEGLAEGTVMHPVQQAFCESDALMCGFCTPGFVTASVALLERNPAPTTEQVRQALDGNICRCGTYQRVIEATLKAMGGRRG